MATSTIAFATMVTSLVSSATTKLTDLMDIDLTPVRSSPKKPAQQDYTRTKSDKGLSLGLKKKKVKSVNPSHLNPPSPTPGPSRIPTHYSKTTRKAFHCPGPRPHPLFTTPTATMSTRSAPLTSTPTFPTSVQTHSNSAATPTTPLPVPTFPINSPELHPPQALLETLPLPPPQTFVNNLARHLCSKKFHENKHEYFSRSAESGHFPTFTKPSFTSDFTRPLSHPNATRLNEAIANLRRDICHIMASHHLDLAREEEAKATQVRSEMEEHYNPDIIRIANCNAKRQAASAPGNRERQTQHPRRRPRRQHQYSTLWHCFLFPPFFFLYFCRLTLI